MVRSLLGFVVTHLFVRFVLTVHGRQILINVVVDFHQLTLNHSDGAPESIVNSSFCANQIPLNRKTFFVVFPASILRYDIEQERRMLLPAEEEDEASKRINGKCCIINLQTVGFVEEKNQSMAGKICII